MRLNSLIWERLYPYVVALVGAIVWYCISNKSILKFPSSDAILSSTLTVSGIFVGFLATCKAILISMDSPVLNDLAETRYIDDLVSYISQAIWWNLVFCLVNVVGYFCQSTSYFSTLWMFFAICALLTFVRVTRIMLEIFKYSQKKEK